MSKLNSKKSQWIDICKLADIPPNSGVCAELNGNQVALFHLQSAANDGLSEVKAISNYDPFAKANVLSRGLITESNNQYFVASPLLKQQFCLDTGRCEQDSELHLVTYHARITGETVQLQGPAS